MNQELSGLGNGTAKTLTRNCRHILSPFSTQNSILQPSYWRGLWLCHTVDDRPGHQSTHYQGFKILTTYILIIIIQPLKLDHVVYVLTHKCSWYPSYWRGPACTIQYWYHYIPWWHHFYWYNDTWCASSLRNQCHQNCNCCHVHSCLSNYIHDYIIHFYSQHRIYLWIKKCIIHFHLKHCNEWQISHTCDFIFDTCHNHTHWTHSYYEMSPCCHKRQHKYT